ncbi:hypothetical protein EOL99_03725 [Candidatus Falkowbacteria bacterium]|nr:hypothetical protein [Candidatus Falkowbacteria bacterium]
MSMKKMVAILLLFFTPQIAFCENRFGVFLQDMGNAMARYLLTGTQFENAVQKKEKKPSVIKLEISNSTKEFQEFGYLKISSPYDSKITLKNKTTNDLYKATIKKNQSQELKIKKGIYTASIEIEGRKKTQTISFLGNQGEFIIK